MERLVLIPYRSLLSNILIYNEVRERYKISLITYKKKQIGKKSKGKIYLKPTSPLLRLYSDLT
jgi:hypothetical protein